MKSGDAGGQTTRRGGVKFVILFLAALILGGIETLVIGLERYQEASSLAVAPVCTSGRVTGCKLYEKVTVVDLYRQGAARAPSTRYARVRKPDGSTQEVGENAGSNLYDLLHINDVLNAELWNGNIIQLDDGAGHYLTATDSPVVTGTLLPIIGVCAIVGGGILLALLIRAMRRARA